MVDDVAGWRLPERAPDVRIRIGQPAPPCQEVSDAGFGWPGQGEHFHGLATGSNHARIPRPLLDSCVAHGPGPTLDTDAGSLRTVDLPTTSDEVFQGATGHESGREEELGDLGRHDTHADGER